MRILLALLTLLAALQPGVAALVRSDYLAIAMSSMALSIAMLCAFYVYWTVARTRRVTRRVQVAEHQAEEISRRIRGT